MSLSTTKSNPQTDTSSLNDPRLALACQIVGQLLATGMIPFSLDAIDRAADIDFSIRLVYAVLANTLPGVGVDFPSVLIDMPEAAVIASQ